MTDVARNMTVEAAPPLHRPGLTPPVLPAASLPQHVAVVMDGNGRWATQRGLHRTEGHKMGEAVLIDTPARSATSRRRLACNAHDPMTASPAPSETSGIPANTNDDRP